MSGKKSLEIRCNCCGRQLKTENGMLLEDAFEGGKEWGYFSRKDPRLPVPAEPHLPPGFPDRTAT